MTVIIPPQKPFPNYKWRWAVLTPTEALNSPPVFIGALRVFNKYDHSAPSSEKIRHALAIVQEETRSTVDLVRTASRNLIRNSGQYWKALGLLEESRGQINVTSFGKLLAESKITQLEFATTVIKTLELPNRRIDSQSEDWDRVGLKIRPLQLILDVLAKLDDLFGSENAFVTVEELIRIIIPLAGVKAPLVDFAEALISYRNNKLDVSSWPNCVTSANDRRMAREYLLFLSNYGFCRCEKSSLGNSLDAFYLSSISKEEVVELQNMSIPQDEPEKAVRTIRLSQIPANIERKKVSRQLLNRPYQTLFRKNVLILFHSTCVITGVTIENVLEAAHIVPVEYKGTDSNENALCLRSDIHQLFDSNNLRICPSGDLILSEPASAQHNYAYLPPSIKLPIFVNRDFLDWRLKYL